MYPLWPYLSPFLALSRPLPLSFTPAELCETPLYCIPTSLTCTILSLATLSSFSSTLLHSSSCSWPWSPHSCKFPMPFDFKPFLLSLCLLLCHIEGIFPQFFAHPPLPLMSVPHRVPYNPPNYWCCGCNIYVSLCTHKHTQRSWHFIPLLHGSCIFLYWQNSQSRKSTHVTIDFTDRSIQLSVLSMQNTKAIHLCFSC